MLVGNDVCVPMVFVLEETGVPGRNPPVWLGDHMTFTQVFDMSMQKSRIETLKLYVN